MYEFLILLGITVIFAYIIYSLTKKITAIIQRQETLLKETNHRVKNSLSLITSLIRLQLHDTQEKTTRGILHDLSARIQSIGKVHNQLNMSKDFSGIYLPEYIHQLAAAFSASADYTNNNISVDTDIQELRLHSDIVIPLGLIITELLSNAYKYAFTENTSGIINIVLKKEAKQYILIVSDNGKGLPDSKKDFSNSETLGLKLVDELAKQLRGSIFPEVKGGTSITLTFPSAD